VEGDGSHGLTYSVVRDSIRNQFNEVQLLVERQPREELVFAPISRLLVDADYLRSVVAAAELWDAELTERERFEEGYAQRSGVDVDWLRERQRAVRCFCGAPECEGWAMLPKVSTA